MIYMHSCIHMYVDASCEVHEEVADRLKGDTRIWVGPYTPEYGYVLTLQNMVCPYTSEYG